MLDKLPLELYWEVLEHLPGHDIHTLSQVSTDLKRRSQRHTDQYLVQRRYCRDFEFYSQDGCPRESDELSGYVTSILSDKKVADAARVLHLDLIKHSVRSLYSISSPKYPDEPFPILRRSPPETQAENEEGERARVNIQDELRAHPLIDPKKIPRLLDDLFNPRSGASLAILMLVAKNATTLKMDSAVLQTRVVKALLDKLVSVRMVNPKWIFAMQGVKELRLEDRAGSMSCLRDMTHTKPDTLPLVSSHLLCLFPNLRDLVIRGFRMGKDAVWNSYLPGSGYKGLAQNFNKSLGGRDSKARKYIRHTGQQAGDRISLRALPEQRWEIETPDWSKRVCRGIRSINLMNAYVDISGGGALDTILTASKQLRDFSWVIQHTFWGPLDHQRVAELLSDKCHQSLTYVRLSSATASDVKHLRSHQWHACNDEGWGWNGHYEIDRTLWLRDDSNPRPKAERIYPHDQLVETPPPPNLLRCWALQTVRLDWHMIGLTPLDAILPPSIRTLVLDHIPNTQEVGKPLTYVKRQTFSFPQLQTLQLRFREFRLSLACDTIFKSLLFELEGAPHSTNLCASVYYGGEDTGTLPPKPSTGEHQACSSPSKPASSDQCSGTSQKQSTRVEVTGCDAASRVYYLLLDSGCDCDTGLPERVDGDRMQRWLRELDDMESRIGDATCLHPRRVVDFHELPPARILKDKRKTWQARPMDKRKRDSSQDPLLDQLEPAFKKFKPEPRPNYWGWW